MANIKLQNFIKKFAILFLIVSTMTGALCSKGGGGVVKVPEKEVTLTIWRLFDSDEIFKPIIETYQSLHPNVKIQYVKKDFAEYEIETTNAIAGGSGPDIWSIHNDWLPKHADKLVEMPEGLLAGGTGKGKKDNLTMLKDNFAPTVSADSVFNNKVYGIPLSVDTLALYYNRDIFFNTRKEYDQKNISLKPEMLTRAPATWDEFVETVKFLTKKDGSNIMGSAVAMGTANNVNRSMDILSVLMMQNNARMVSADQKSAIFNQPIKKETGEQVYAGTNALDFYTSFANPSKETYTWNNSFASSADAFAKGQTAMMINYSYQQSYLAQKAPTLNYSIAPLPQIRGAAVPIDYPSYWIETVTKSSKNPDVAWDFINFLYTKGGDLYLTFTKKPPAKISGAAKLSVAERIGATNPFTFQVVTAQSWYKGKSPTKVDNIFAEMIENVISKNQPLQNAIDTAASAVTKLLVSDISQE